MKLLSKIAFIIPLAVVLATVPVQKGYCECAVEGGVCGEAPTWNPCCEPDRLECVKDEDEEYGTCEPKEEE